MMVRSITYGIATSLLCAFAGPVTATDSRVTPPQGSADMQVVLLGTAAGPIPRAQRSQPATAIVVGKRLYLFDAGDGVARQLVGAGSRPTDVTAIFLTHLHFDHVAGLAALLGFKWAAYQMQPVPIFGPPGTMALVKAAIDYLAIPIALFSLQYPKMPELKTTFPARDGSPDIVGQHPRLIYRDDTVRVLAVANSHYTTLHLPKRSYGYDSSYSYRIETRERSVVLTGDTGTSDAVTELARGADLLISEVIDLPKVLSIIKGIKDVPQAALAQTAEHMRKEHLTPEQVGQLAAAAGVKKVVLTHLSPGADTSTDPTEYSEGVKRYYRGPVVVGNDFDRY